MNYYHVSQWTSSVLLLHQLCYVSAPECVFVLRSLMHYFWAHLFVHREEIKLNQQCFWAPHMHTSQRMASLIKCVPVCSNKLLKLSLMKIHHISTHIRAITSKFFLLIFLIILIFDLLSKKNTKSKWYISLTTPWEVTSSPLPCLCTCLMPSDNFRRRKMLCSVWKRLLSSFDLPLKALWIKPTDLYLRVCVHQYAWLHFCSL